MTTIWLPCGLLLSVLLMAPAAGVFAAEAPVRVLIVDGYSNHDWRLTTALIRGILEPVGLFKVDVSTAPPTKGAPGWDVWRPRFSEYDVLIQTCNDLGRWPALAARGAGGLRGVRAQRRRRSMSGMAATTPLPTGPPTTR